MRDKELKKLSRAELLELLLEQTRQKEQLEKRLEKAEALLSDRYLKIHEAGDLAHAVLMVNGVMEAAQAAAQQYLENIQKLEEQTREECDSLLEQAREEARKICEGEMKRTAPVPEAEEMKEALPDDLPEEQDT